MIRLNAKITKKYPVVTFLFYLYWGSWDIEFRVSVQVDTVDIGTLVVSGTGKIFIGTEDNDNATEDDETGCDSAHCEAEEMIILWELFFLQFPEELYLCR